jgi:predicted TIM-barrel fold metal-dependent hydrolase
MPWTFEQRADVSAIRAKIDHPIVDVDAHMIEAEFAFPDFLKKVGGPEIAERFAKLRANRGDRNRGAFWGSPSGKYSIDRITVMLPRLYRQRLEEAGIDFGIVYTSLGLGAMWVRDAELRRAYHRALNLMYADMYRDVQDRLIPAAMIPTQTLEEAIDELEYAVGELGFKVITVAGERRRAHPEIEHLAPHLANYSQIVEPLMLEEPTAYDRFWQRCQELKVAVTSHSGAQGTQRHNSRANFVYNRLGSFGVGGEHFARSLFLAGVTRRFPDLTFGFLEGGVARICALYNDLFEFWEKRNPRALHENCNPAELDTELMARMAAEYGNDWLTSENIRTNPHNQFSRPTDTPAQLDDFAACGIAEEEDIKSLFVPNFYIGCEADDRMNACAFDTRLNHKGARLKAMFSSDIGHWDVVDMTGVVPSAYGLVRRGLITEDDFRDFMFTNAVEMHGRMNPNFFKGTAVEAEAEKVLARFREPKTTQAAE